MIRWWYGSATVRLLYLHYTSVRKKKTAFKFVLYHKQKNFIKHDQEWTYEKEAAKSF